MNITSFFFKKANHRNSSPFVFFKKNTTFFSAGLWCFGLTHFWLGHERSALSTQSHHQRAAHWHQLLRHLWRRRRRWQQRPIVTGIDSTWWHRSAQVGRLPFARRFSVFVSKKNKNFFSSFANSESALVALDLGGIGGGPPDGNMDVLLGYPSQQAADSDRFPCGQTTFDTSCFGLYLYSGTGYDSPK